MKLTLAVLALSAILLSLPAEAKLSRTWVSGTGDDTNPCTRTLPCATFAQALANTTAGGEIDCTDAGSFDPVTISQPVTIDCGSGESGSVGAIQAVSGQNGITVQAGVNDVVTIRKLTINGLSRTGAGGISGIYFQSGKSLEVDGVDIMHFATAGVSASPNGNSSLYVVNSTLSDNGATPTSQIYLQPASGAGLVNLIVQNVIMLGGTSGLVIYNNNATTTVHAAIKDTLAAGGSLFGFYSYSDGGRVTLAIDHCTAANNGAAGVEVNGSNVDEEIGNSLIYGNQTGVRSFPPDAVMLSYKNNEIRLNGSNGTPISGDTLE